MRIQSIVGARPQFVKMAVVCRTLSREPFASEIDHSIIHTGQHYDHDMSSVFFSELGIPAPAYHLGVGSGSHAVQTGEMMKRLEEVLVESRPDWVLLYGDTNSTLAGAVVCAKLNIRTAHIEAGLRSFNRTMPEEINRIVADHLSEVLFCPTEEAARNLRTEGLQDKATLSGDVMYDAALEYRSIAEARSIALCDRFPEKKYALATIHRAENTDDPVRLRQILMALDTLAKDVCPIVLPLHPRTKKCIEAAGVQLEAVSVLRPVSYLEMLALENRACFIVTDSGGVQKEAYFAQVPCITTRDETEWVETLSNRCNVLTGVDRKAIIDAARSSGSAGPWGYPYGHGNSCEIMLRTLQAKGRTQERAAVAAAV